MSISLLGQMVLYLWLASVIFVIPFSYYFGLKKTDTPKAIACIGGLLCFFPPFNFIYLMILALMPKNFGKTKSHKDPQALV